MPGLYIYCKILLSLALGKNTASNESHWQPLEQDSDDSDDDDDDDAVDDLLDSDEDEIDEDGQVYLESLQVSFNGDLHHICLLTVELFGCL